MKLEDVKRELRKTADEKIATHALRFFKTGKGEYGEGDTFIGVRVPQIRALAKKAKSLSDQEAETLIQSPIHEERMLGLFIWRHQFDKGDTARQSQIYQSYLDHVAHINNWDLVDCSAHYIVGQYLYERSRKPLYKLARSKNLWERRIAIMATFYFIKQNDFEDSLSLVEILLHDSEDLIHKATGWMLREIGNRHMKTEEEFLKPRYQTMPRTMLRYAIEKFPETKRHRYLSGKI
ncbi:MAG: DNA alkylation repair protein [Gammaproteobacteria bacterium]|nr:DNA alkylation repair protein [Gammaproteobacteria bacterium]